MPKNLFLVGYYGFGNFGDEWLLEKTKVLLKAHIPEAKFSILKPSHRYNWLGLLRQVKKADLVVFGGGSLFQDKTSSRSFNFYYHILKKAQALKKQTWLLGHGMGPITNSQNKKKLAAILNKTDLLITRDPESTVFLNKIGVTPTDTLCDLTFLNAKITNTEDTPFETVNRYHPAIKAALNSTPFLMNATDPKHESIANQLEQPIKKADQEWAVYNKKLIKNVQKLTENAKKYNFWVNKKLHQSELVSSSLSIVKALKTIDSLIKSPKPKTLITLNPLIYESCSKTPERQTYLKTADLILCDGIGIKLKSKQNPPIIPGVELTEALLQQSYKTYLLGAKSEVLETLKSKFKKTNIVGSHHGYFKDSAPIIEDIKSKSPELILVALGTPKQEDFIIALKSRLQKGLIIGVGGTFDVLSGTIKRTPAIIRRIRLEWAYRMLSDPKRLKQVPALLRFLLRSRRHFPNYF